LLFLM
jgi:hypothetical protein